MVNVFKITVMVKLGNVLLGPSSGETQTHVLSNHWLQTSLYVRSWASRRVLRFWRPSIHIILYWCWHRASTFDNWSLVHMLFMLDFRLKLVLLVDLASEWLASFTFLLDYFIERFSRNFFVCLIFPGYGSAIGVIQRQIRPYLSRINTWILSLRYAVNGLMNILD